MSPGKTRLALLTLVCMLLNCSFQQITSRRITSFATEVERKQKKKSLANFKTAAAHDYK